MNNASENGFDDCLHLIYRGKQSAYLPSCEKDGIIDMQLRKY